MNLPNDLVSQLAKLNKPEKKNDSQTIVYGTAVVNNGTTYVQMDGSDQLTPIDKTTDTQNGERVLVMLKNHTATIIGNVTSPSARSEDVKAVANDVLKIREVVADTVTTKDLEAEKARIDSLEADNVVIKKDLKASSAEISDLKTKNLEVTGKLEAQEGKIENLESTTITTETANATYATIKNLEVTNEHVNNLSGEFGEFKNLASDQFKANSADIEKLKTGKLDAETANATYATIKNLEATNGHINNLSGEFGEFKSLTSDQFKANSADIEKLKTDKLDATDADIKYANIDFSNIGEAAMKYLYSESGLIKDITIDKGTITGELVGVTISGDLIKGNTIVADKLVVKGKDGLYYKLNADGNTIEKEQTDYNSLNGSVIKAHSITATKISVEDLVAFGATIGGFKITKDSIFSGVKESVLNDTRGIYLDNTGQISFGDSANYIRYFKDSDGKYKLDISADAFSIKSGDGTGQDISDAIQNIKQDIDNVRDEITTLLRIESSRGTVFKNNTTATVLSVVVYHGKDRITDIDKLHEVYGSSAYIQWKWQRLDDETYGIISSADSRMGNGGFSFTLSPDDVDTKVTFMCELITD